MQGAAEMAPRKGSKPDVEEELPVTPVKPTESVESMTPASMKVTELRDALAARGLSAKGLKKELVERLEEALSGAGSAEKDVEMAEPIQEDEPPKETKTEEAKSPEPVVKAAELKAGPVEPKPASSQAKEPVEAPKAKELVEAPKPIETRPAERPVAKRSSEPEKSTSVVHITGFVRPFTLQSAKDLVEGFGAITGFWMDSIKSHCYVAYKEQASADACMKSLNGKQWPENLGKVLSVAHSTETAMKAAEEGDAAQADTRRRASIVSQNGDETQSKRVKGLDELFRKTEAKPHLYYLPAKQF